MTGCYAPNDWADLKTDVEFDQMSDSEYYSSQEFAEKKVMCDKMKLSPFDFPGKEGMEELQRRYEVHKAWAAFREYRHYGVPMTKEQLKLLDCETTDDLPF